MADRVRSSIEEALLQNPFHADHYVALAQAVTMGSLALPDALDILAKVVDQLPDADEIARVVPMLERAFGAILASLDDRLAKREIVIGLGRIARDVLKDSKRALAHFAHAFELQPDPDLALELGLVGLGVFGDGWARRYLDAHADTAAEPDPRVLFKLAEIALQDDDLGTARRRLARLLERHPDHELAQEYLESIRQRSGSLEEEILHLEEALAGASAEERALLLKELARYRLMMDPDSPEGIAALLTLFHDHGERDPETLGLLSAALERAGRAAEQAEVLDAQVQIPAGAEAVAALHRKLGDLYLGPLQEPDRGRRHFEAAASLDPRNAEGMRRLEEIYRAKGDTTALADVLEKALKGAADRDQEVLLLQRLGRLYWRDLRDARSAERVYKRLRTLTPDDLEPLDFYQDLYIEQRRYDNLFSIFSHKAEILVGEPLVEAARQVEAITENAAGSPEKLLEIWKKVIRHEPNHDYAATRYTELLIQLGRWHSVIDFLKARLKTFADEQKDDKLELLYQIIEIFSNPDKLNMDDMGTNTWREVLDLDPTNLRAIDALTTRYREAGRHRDLARVLLSKVDLSTDAAEKRELLAEVLDIATKRVRDVETAVGALEKLHELDPADTEVIQQLKAHYRQRKDYVKLVALLKEELGSLPTAEARKETLLEIARMAQEKLGDSDETIRLLEEVLEADPADEKIRTRLETIYRKLERFDDLARLYRERLDVTDDANARVALLDKLGKVYLDQLEDYAQAEVVFLEILDLRPSKILTQSYLERIYLRTRAWDKLRSLYAADGNWAGYLTTLSESLEAGQSQDDTLAILEETASIQREKLANPAAERAALERVRTLAPGHLPALRRLRSIYAVANDAVALERTLGDLLAGSDDEAERIDVLDALAEMRARVGRTVEARDILLKHLDTLLVRGATASLDRLRALLDDPDAIEACREALAGALERDLPEAGVQRALEELGALYADVLHDADNAVAIYHRLLEAAPAHAGAIRRLGTLLEAEGRTGELVELLQGTLAFEDRPEARADVLVRLAEIAEEHQDDRDQAVRYLLQALDENPRGAGLYEAIERHYQEQGRWNDVADLYLRRIDEASDDTERDSLRLSLARVYVQLEQIDDALDLLEALAGASALSTDAIEAIEELLTSEAEVERTWTFLAGWREQHGEWDALVDLLERRYASTKSPELLKRIADLHADHAADRGRAFDAQARFLGVDPSSRDEWDRLAALADELERHGELFAAYGEAVGLVAADEHARLDDESLANELLLRMAALSRDRLDDLDSAVALYQRYREREPDDGAVIDQLLQIHERTGDREALLALNKEKLERTWSGPEKQAVLERVCSLLRELPGREEELIEHYEALLGLDEHRPDLVHALDELYERFERFEPLVHLIRDRILPSLQTDDERLSATTRLAGLQWLRLSDPHGAVETLKEALALDPAHPTVLDVFDEMLDEGDEDLKARVVQILEPVCIEQGLSERLVRLLGVKADASDDVFEKAQLRDRMAALFEQDLNAQETGLDLRLSALLDHPTGERLREVYNRAGVLGQWEKLAAALREVLAQPGLLDAEAAYLLGELQVDHLQNPDEAARWFERVRDEEPSNTRALERLRGIYHGRGEAEREAEALTALIELEPDTAKRRDLVRQLAELEESRERFAAAEEAWQTSIELGASRVDASANEAYDRLRALLRQAGKLEALIDVLRDRHAFLEDPTARRDALYEIAELQREAKRVDEAVDTYREILADEPDDPVARGSIESIYFDAERWSDYESFLLENLERAADSERVAILRKLGTYYLYYSEDLGQALDAHRRILGLDPSDTEALDTVVGLLESPEVRADVFQFLDDFTRAEGHAELRDQVLRTVLASFSDAEFDRRAVLAELARLNHEIFAREADAAEFASLCYRLDGTDDEAYARAVDISAALGSFEHVVRALDDLAADAAPDDRVPLLLRKALLLRDQVGDAVAAEATLESLLQLDPAYEPALDAQIALLRTPEGDAAKLAARLEARLELTADAAARAAVLRELGELRRRLDDPKGAVKALEEALLEAPDDEALYDQVAELLNGLGDRDGALDALRQKLERLGGEPERDLALRHQVLDQLVGWPERADDAREAALGIVDRFGFDEAAVTCLEQAVRDGEAVEVLVSVLDRVLGEAGLHGRLAAVYEEALPAAPDADVAASWRTAVRDLYESRLDAADAALRHQLELVRQDPGDEARLDHAEELAELADGWGELVAFLQELQGDADDALAVDLCLRIARVTGGRLNDADAATQFYRLVLDRDPGNPDAFGALADLYEKSGDWADLALLHEAMAHTLSGSDEKALHLDTACRVARDRLHDSGMARSFLRQLVELRPDDVAAVEGLEALYREAGDNDQLRWLYPFALEHLPDAEVRAALRCRYASLLIETSDEHLEAIGQIEEALADVPSLSAASELLEHVLDLEYLPRAHKARILARTIELLEGLYTPETDAERQVLLKEKKLGVLDQASDQIEVLRELAELHEHRTADPLRAFDALARAFRARPDEDLHAELAGLCQRLDLQENLAAVYAELLEASDDDALLNATLRRLGDLLRGPLGRADEATPHLAIYNKRVPGDPEVLQFLEGAYRSQDNPKELLGILEDRARFTDDPDEKGMLLLEAADLVATRLADDTHLAELYAHYLEVDPQAHDVAEKLEGLLAKAGNVQALVRFYEERLSQTTDPGRRVAYLKRNAQLRETTLKEIDEAVTLLEEILSIDARNAYALSSLERIYTADANDDGLYRILTLRLKATDDATARAGIDLKLADLQLHKLESPVGALKHIAAVLEVDAANADALRLADELLEAPDTTMGAFDLLQETWTRVEDHVSLAGLYDRMYERTDDILFRAALASKSAALAELVFGDDGAALVHLGRAFSNEPDNLAYREHIRALASKPALAEQAAGMLPDLVASVADESGRLEAAREFGAFLATVLDDPTPAIDLYEIARGVAPDDEELLQQLAALREKTGDRSRLLDLWEQLGGASDPDVSRTFRLKLGEARLSERETQDLGLDMLSELYLEGYEVEHIAALLADAVDRVRDPSTLIDLLERHYRERDELAALAGILQVRLSLQEDASDQADLCREIGALYRDRLEDYEQAFDLLLRAATLDARQRELLPDLEALAETIGALPRLAEAIEGFVQDERDDKVRADLLRTLLRLYDGPLATPADAERALSALVELAPHDLDLLDRLLALYAASGRDREWLKLATTRAEQEPDALRRHELLEGIAAKARAANDGDGEMRALEALLEADALDDEGQARLEELYSTSAQPDRVALLIEKRLEREDDPEKIVEGTLQLAEMRLQGGADSSTVAGLLERVLDVDPANERALHMLANVFRGAGLAHQLVDVLRRLAEATADAATRVGYLGEMAAATRDQLGDKAGAARLFEEIARLDPAHQQAARELARLYEEQDDAEKLLQALNRLVRFAHDQAEQSSLLTRSARLNATRLGQIDRARELLQNVLAQDPHFQDALVLSAELAERAGQHDEARQAFERLLETELDVATRKGVLASLVGILLAESAWQPARERLLEQLSTDPADRTARDRLLDVLQKLEAWDDLVSLLEQKAGESTRDVERAGFYRRIAEIRLAQGDEAGFEAWIKRAYETKRDSEETVSVLIDFYRRHDRRAELVPLLEWYVSYLEVQKRFDLFARFAGELADELFELGREAQALELRKVVKKHDPNDFANLLGLARLYYEQGELDESQKTLQMMLLKQHQISDGGVKSGMYLTLARITARQGNPKKALQYVQRVLQAEPDHVEASELKAELS